MNAYEIATVVLLALLAVAVIVIALYSSAKLQRQKQTAHGRQIVVAGAPADVLGCYPGL